MTHIATRTLRGQLRGKRATTLRFGGTAAWKPNGSERKTRSHPHSGPRRERTEDGWRRQRDEPEQAEVWRQRPLHAQRAEGRESGAGRPPDHAQHVKKRAEENTWVSTWTGEKGSREATLESHGVPWRAAHENCKISRKRCRVARDVTETDSCREKHL